jgi:uncharacterized protein
MATGRKRTAARTGRARKTARPARGRKAAKSGRARKAGKTARKRTATRALKSTRAGKSAAARKSGSARKAARGRKGAGKRTARKAARTSAPAAPRAKNPVNWFEIPVRDIVRAQAFYERVLQTTLTYHDMGSFKMAWFPSNPEGWGATGTLMQSEGYVPSHIGSMVYFSVPDISATLERAQANGGRVLNPKMSIGEYGFVAHFEDCEGNRVALHAMS